MIDRIRLKILLDESFEDLTYSDLPNLKFATYKQTDDKLVTEVKDYHSWQKLPSSHSGIAFHLHKDYQENVTYLFLDCSPAKALTYQNVFGSDDFGEQAYIMLDIFGRYHPDIFSFVNIDHVYVQSVDVAYYVKLDSKSQVISLFDSLSELQHKNLKASRPYPTTIYINTKSEYYGWKIYSKQHEIQHAMKSKNIYNYLPECLVSTTTGLVRYEVTLKTKYFKQNGLSTNLKRFAKIFNAREYWTMAYEKIKEATSTCRDIKTMKTDINALIRSYLFTIDKNGNYNYRTATRVYSTYLAIENYGYKQVKEEEIVPRSTFYKHVKQLEICGLSKIYLQNLHKTKTAKIIPMTRFVELTFSDYYPQNVKEADFYELAKAI